MNVRVYIFQNNKTVDFFDTNSFQIDEGIRKECDKLMSWAIDSGKAEKGYYRVEVVHLDGCITTDSEDLIAIA